MRNALTQCARLLPLVLVAAACSSKAVASNHSHAGVTISGTCAPNQVTLVVNPSTVKFHHTNLLHHPTDVEWTLDANSTIDNVTLAPKSAAEWPFEGSPTPIPKGQSYTGVGKSDQAKNHYPYSVTVTCNGTTVIFDPDIWVD